MVGPHGTNKTEGAEVLSKALLGRNTAFIKYDTPLLNSDDFLGYPNPKSLQDGKVDFIGTEISIWNADSVMFDEINRANPFSAAKLMACIRTKKVMGIDTKVKHVFGGVNPPEMYDAIYMDLAMASRWITVTVPGTAQMSEKDLRAIMQLAIRGLKDEAIDKPEDRVDPQALEEFKESMSRAKAVIYKDEDIDEAVKVVSKLVKEVGKEANVQPRQGQSMLKLLLACAQLESAEVIKNVPTEIRTELLMSCIPQVHGITKKSISANQLRAKFNQYLNAFKLGDPLLASATLPELTKVDQTADPFAWASSCIQAIEGERDVSEIKKFALHLKERLSKKLIQPAGFNMIAEPMVQRYLGLVQPRDLPDKVWKIQLGYDRHGLIKLIDAVFS